MEDLFAALRYTIIIKEKTLGERGKNENAGSGSEDNTGHPHV